MVGWYALRAPTKAVYALLLISAVEASGTSVIGVPVWAVSVSAVCIGAVLVLVLFNSVLAYKLYEKSIRSSPPPLLKSEPAKKQESAKSVKKENSTEKISNSSISTKSKVEKSVSNTRKPERSSKKSKVESLPAIVHFKSIKKVESSSSKSSKTEKIDKIPVKSMPIPSPKSSEVKLIQKTPKPAKPVKKPFEWTVAVPKRSEESYLNEPVTNEEFLVFSEALAKWAVHYRNNSGDYPVTPDCKIGNLFSTIPKTAPMKPESFAQIVKDFEGIIVPKLTHWNHPRFHAYFPMNRSYSDTLGEMMSAITGVVSLNSDSFPEVQELENAMINWMGRAIGLPQEFLFGDSPVDSNGGGTLFDSTSEATVCCIMASRQWKISQISKKYPGEMTAHDGSSDLKGIHDLTKKMVAYGSKDAHPYFEKACKLSMVKCRLYDAKESNKWGITGDQLGAEIKRDIAKGLIPFHVHVTYGTMSTCASDDLDSILPVAKKYNLWLHVDASYVGSAWICPELRYRTNSLRYVDSINCNAAEWMLHSQPQVFLWTTKQKEFKDAFNSTQGYSGSVAKTNEPGDCWGIRPSRRFKSLKSLLVFRLYGINHLQKRIRMHVEHTKFLCELVKKHPNCVVFSSNYAIMTFFYKEPGMSHHEINDSTQKLAKYINKSHKLYLSHTKIGNQAVIRIVISYELSTKKIVEESWKIIEKLIKEFQLKRKCAKESSLTLPMLQSVKPIPTDSYKEITVETPPTTPPLEPEISTATAIGEVSSTQLETIVSNKDMEIGIPTTPQTSSTDLSMKK